MREVEFTDKKSGGPGVRSCRSFSPYDIDVITALSYMQSCRFFDCGPICAPFEPMGFDEAGMAEIEQSICATPDKHPTMRGLRGVRKARFARPGTGKSGGGRSINYAMIDLGRMYMMTAYPKSKQGDLTADDRKAILRVIEQLLRGDQL